LTFQQTALNGGTMWVVFNIFFIVIDLYVLIDFIKPLYKKKYLRNGYKFRFISPIWTYIILFLAFLGSIYYLYLYVTQKEVDCIIFFNMLFIIAIYELSKSYILVCKTGLFIGGIYFSNTEKQEGQYVTRIMIWNRRIYVIKTTSKFAYVYLRKKYIDEMTK
jgi:hypothetical protein